MDCYCCGARNQTGITYQEGVEVFACMKCVKHGRLEGMKDFQEALI